MMTIDPELLLLGAIVAALAGLIWLVPASRAVYRVTRRGGAMPITSPGAAAIKRRPVTLLTVPVKPDRAVRSLVRDAAGERSRDEPADAIGPTVGAHMARVGDIVAASIETALRAQRLHRTAHERVDSAHYALQNLLSELSAIMPIIAPAPSTRQSPVARSRTALRPVYETALAA